MTGTHPLLTPQQLEHLKENRVYTAEQLCTLKEQIAALKQINRSLKEWRIQQRKANKSPNVQTPGGPTHPSSETSHPLEGQLGLAYASGRMKGTCTPFGAAIPAGEQQGSRASTSSRQTCNTTEPQAKELACQASAVQQQQGLARHKRRAWDHHPPKIKKRKAEAAKTLATVGSSNLQQQQRRPVAMPPKALSVRPDKPMVRLPRRSCRQHNKVDFAKLNAAEGSEDEEGEGGSGPLPPVGADSAGRGDAGSVIGTPGGAALADGSGAGGGEGQCCSEDGVSARPVQLPDLRAVIPQAMNDEVICSVCGDADDGEGNAILLCDGCDTAVHQQCYGVRRVPEGEWKCDGCKAGLDPSASHCAVCPVVGGALRQVVSMGTLLPPPGGKTPTGRTSRRASGSRVIGGNGKMWVHGACALWVPEIEFRDPSSLSGVVLDKLPLARVNLRCFCCGQGGGGTLQCSYGSCCRPFHVLCGLARGLETAFCEKDCAPLGFCERHSSAHFTVGRERMARGVVLHGSGVQEELDALDAAAAEAEQQQQGGGGAQQEQVVNEYEAQRQRNMERNKRRLEQLGLSKGLTLL